MIWQRPTHSLEDGKLGLGEDASRSGLGGGGEDSEVSLDLVSRTERVEESDNGVLSHKLSFRIASHHGPLLTRSIPLAEETELAKPRFLISAPTFFTSSSRTTLLFLMPLTGAEGELKARAGWTERRMEAGRGREDIRLTIIVMGLTRGWR
jgi:hypothetical protein